MMIFSEKKLLRFSNREALINTQALQFTAFWSTGVCGEHWQMLWETFSQALHVGSFPS